MPSGNQGKGRRNEGPGPGAREPAQDLGQQVRAGAEQVGSRLQEGYGAARDDLARRYREVEGTVARNPMSSVMIGFGAGFGLGLVVTILLTRPEPTWSERHLPDSLRNLPDAFQDLADSLRSLPKTLASQVPSSLTRR